MTTPCPSAPSLSFFPIYSPSSQNAPNPCSLFSQSVHTSLLHLLPSLDQTLHDRPSIISLHHLHLLGSVLGLCSSSKSPVSQHACSPGLQRWLEKRHSWEGLPFQRHSFHSQVCSDTLFPAQVSSLSLVTTVMIPTLTLSLNCLPNNVFTLTTHLLSYFTKKIGTLRWELSQHPKCICV